MTARTDLPSGTVVFRFTDVEGSTKLFHALGAREFPRYAVVAGLCRDRITDAILLGVPTLRAQRSGGNA